MRKNILIIVAAILVISNAVIAQESADHTKDEKSIREIVQNIQDAWTAGDSVKFADQFTDDVDYTVWNGIQIRGREENIAGHKQIFETIYKGTQLKADVRKIRFLTDNVAAVHLEGNLYKDGKLFAGQPTVVPVMIFMKEDAKWKVVVFQNTPIINRGELVLGRTAKADKN